jgi:hypothetical protein
MLSFKSFILLEDEQVVKKLEKAKSITSYIESDKLREKYVTAIDSLILGAQKQEIYKARFEEHKTTINSAINRTWDKLTTSLRDEIAKNEDTYGIWSIYGVNDIKGVEKTFSKFKVKPSLMASFIDSVRDLPEVFKALKTYIKAGKPPKEPVPGQFIKPMASMQAIKLAQQIISNTADSFKQKLKADLEDSTYDIFEKIKNAETPKDIPNTDHAKSIASLIFVIKTREGKKHFELLPDAKKRLDKSIQNTTDEIIDGFVSKTASKLANIFEKKTGVKEHRIVRTNIRNGMVENVMFFVFDDNSKFTLESSVIYKVSSTGKFFFQYPTRFKDVFFADGTKMKMPSEEKMIKEF